MLNVGSRSWELDLQGLGGNVHLRGGLSHRAWTAGTPHGCSPLSGTRRAPMRISLVDWEDRCCDELARRGSLVVAHRTAATPKLLEQVRTRARQGSCSFVLLVPRPYWDPETEEAAKVIELAVPLLEEAASARVEAIVGDSRPFRRSARGA